MGGMGKPRFLSTDEEQELTEEVSTGRFRTAGEIRDWIESEYGVSYKSGSVSQIPHLTWLGAAWCAFRGCPGVDQG